MGWVGGKEHKVTGESKRIRPYRFGRGLEKEKQLACRNLGGEGEGEQNSKHTVS